MAFIDDVRFDMARGRFPNTTTEETNMDIDSQAPEPQSETNTAYAEDSLGQHFHEAQEATLTKGWDLDVVRDLMKTPFRDVNPVRYSYLVWCDPISESGRHQLTGSEKSKVLNGELFIKTCVPCKVQVTSRVVEEFGAEMVKSTTVELSESEAIGAARVLELAARGTEVVNLCETNLRAAKELREYAHTLTTPSIADWGRPDWTGRSPWGQDPNPEMGIYEATWVEGRTRRVYAHNEAEALQQLVDLGQIKIERVQ